MGKTLAVATSLPTAAYITDLHVAANRNTHTTAIWTGGLKTAVTYTNTPSVMVQSNYFRHQLVSRDANISFWFFGFPYILYLHFLRITFYTRILTESPHSCVTDEYGTEKKLLIHTVHLSVSSTKSMPHLRSSRLWLTNMTDRMWYCKFLPSVGTYPPDNTMSHRAQSTLAGKPNRKKRPTHTTRGKKFDVLASVLTRIQKVWNVMLYHRVNGCWHSAETSAATHHPVTQRHIPEYLNP